MVEIFYGKIKCNGDSRSDFLCRCGIWKRTKFDHDNITNLTEQNI